MHSDPIADYLTRMRNALAAGKKVVEIPSSGLKKAITELLISQKFLNGYEEIKESAQPKLRINLKYTDGQPVIIGLQRISKPGLRQYFPSEELPRVFNGLGIAVVTTSQGVITDNQARKLGIGGEVLCYIW